MTADTVHARLVADHDDLDVLLERLIIAYQTNARDIAACAYAELEHVLATHLEADEQLGLVQMLRTQLASVRP